MFEGNGRVQEYVGGYEDWLRQRPREKVPPEHDTTVTPAQRADHKPKTPAIGTNPKKLSFNEQRELGVLPAVIEALESEQRALAERIARPDFYKEGATSINRALARVDELESTLTAAYARWGELDSRN